MFVKSISFDWLKRSRLLQQKPIHDRLRAFLVTARQKSGHSQRSLAAKLGWQQTLIARIERGERSVELSEFVALCEVFGEDPSGVLASLLANDLGGSRDDAEPGTP